MARKRVTYENLDKAIKDILDDYTQIVWENVDEATEKVAKKTRLAVANGSKQFDERWGTGKYSGGWRVTKEENARGWFVTYIVHNKRKPTQTHLLEYGHELNTGGRAKAYPHIEPVAENVPDDLQRETIHAIQRSN